MVRPILSPCITAPADAVGAAQQARRVGHVAFEEGGADGRAGNPLALMDQGVHRLDGEARLLAGGVEHREVADAALAETEVVADQQVTHAEAVDQHVLDELLGGEGPRSAMLKRAM